MRMEQSDLSKKCCAKTSFWTQKSVCVHGNLMHIISPQMVQTPKHFRTGSGMHFLVNNCDLVSRRVDDNARKQECNCNVPNKLQTSCFMVKSLANLVKMISCFVKDRFICKLPPTTSSCKLPPTTSSMLILYTPHVCEKVSKLCKLCDFKYGQWI